MQLAFASGTNANATRPETRAKVRALLSYASVVLPPVPLTFTPYLRGASLIEQGERVIRPWVKLSIRRDATDVAY